MDWKVTTSPVVEPISLVEAKLHLRVDHSNDDVLIGSIITAAREWAEHYEGRCYVLQTITAKLDKFADKIKLPYPPLISVSSIQYVDVEGVTQTVDSSVYDVDVTSVPGVVSLAYGELWPTARAQHHAVTITYLAGFATNFTSTNADNSITLKGRALSNGDVVRLSTTDGDLPNGYSENLDYYVVNATGTKCELSLSEGGATVTISDDGIGNHFIGVVPQRSKQAMKLIIGHLYEHREEVSEVKLERVPMAARALLDMNKVYL